MFDVGFVVRRGGRLWAGQVVAVVVAAGVAWGVGGLVTEALAAESDARLEVAPLRAERAVTEQLPDGTFVTHLSGAPVNFKPDPVGPWEPADVTLVAATGVGEKRWETSRAGYVAKLGANADGEVVSFEAGGLGVGVSMVGAAAVAGSKTGQERVRYGGVFAQTDVVYETIPSGLKETVVLGDASAPSAYTFRLRGLRGGELSAVLQRDGSVAVSGRKDGEVAFRIARPVVSDAAEVSGPVKVAIDAGKTTGVLEVSYAIDRAWLADPDRVFPVELDPTFETDVVVQDGFYDTTAGGNPDVSSTNLRVGKNGAAGSVYQGVVTYDFAAIPRSARVVSATAQLYVAGCLGVSCPGTANNTVNGTLELHGLTSGWSSATPWASVSQSATVLASKAMNVGVSGGDSVGSWVSLTGAGLESAVQDIVTGAAANYGFALQRTGGAANVGFQFASSRYTAGNGTVFAPKIDVYWASDSPTLQPVALARGNGADLSWAPATGGIGAYRDAVMTDSPQLFYRLNESSGPGVYDWSGNDRNATSSGTVTFNQAGGLSEGDKAVAFDGSTGYLTTTSAPSLAGQSFSVEAWVKRGSVGTDDWIVGHGTASGNNGLHFGFRSNNTLTCAFYGNDLNTVATFTDLGWHHVVCTYDAGSNQRTLYYDGSQVAQATASADYGGSGSLWVGQTFGSGGRLAGVVDEVAVFSSTLSPTRVAAHYTAGTQAYPSISTVEVHRSLVSGFTPSAATLVQTVADTVLLRWADTTAAPNTTYYYRLKSVKTDASTVVSNEIAVTTPADGKARLTVQPGLVGQRASGDYIKNGDGVHSGYSYLEVGPSARTLVSFDDQRQIPAIASVTSAQLKMFAYGPGVSGTLSAHRLTTQWSEGGTTWTQARPGTNWTTAGGDFNATADGTAADNGAGPHWVALDVTDMTQKWVAAQAAQYGTLVKWQTETGAATQKFLADGYAASIALRPKLEITFDDPSAKTVKPVPVFSNVAAGQRVKGTTAITAAATDDSAVAQIEFLLDGVVKQTSSVLPATWSWDSTTASRGAHILALRATDDAGNVTTGPDTAVNVANSSAPTVSAPTVTSAGSGNFTTAATASDDFAVTKVEFFVDGELYATDTSSPFSTTLNTLSFPVYDGSRVVTSRAYDEDGNVTTSIGTTFNPANTNGTKYQASFTTSTVIPDEQRPADGFSATYTVQNTGTVTIPNASTVLRWQWLDPTGAVASTSSNIALGGDITAGASRNVTFTVTPPSLPTPFMRGRYLLRIDLFDTGASTYFAAKGNKPYQTTVALTKQTADEIGLERYQMYSQVDAGALAGSVNVFNGNLNLAMELFNQPGIGLDSRLTLAYNSLEQGTVGPLGNGWLLSAGLLPLGERLDIHPNAADTAAGRTAQWVGLVDGDGTVHRFDHVANDVYEEPKGVYLYARRANLDSTRVWGFTRPDRTTFWFDANGWPTKVADADGNTLTFTHATPPAGEDPYGIGKRLTTITDQGNRTVTFAYVTAAAANRAGQAGRLASVTDHAGHVWRFTYYEDGNLLRITQEGGTTWDGAHQADRAVVLTYTNPAGTAAAIPVQADRVDPAPATSQGTLLFSATDWRGKETTFAYAAARLDTATSRVGQVTDFGWNAGTQTATVALPGTGKDTTTGTDLPRTYTHVLDSEGKVTSITDPLAGQTTVQWSTTDNVVQQITEPGNHQITYTYNKNGYLLTQTEQLNATDTATTSITYQNLAADSLDVSGNWPAARTVGHISQPTTIVRPVGVSTTSDASDYSTTLAYDSEGHVTTVTNDFTGAVTTNDWNTDGTLNYQQLADAGDGIARRTTFNTYDLNGLATKVTDAAGGVIEAAYRADGLPLWSQDAIHASAPDGDPSSSTIYRYDSLGVSGVSSSPRSSSLYPGQLVWTGDPTTDLNGNPTVERQPRYGRGYAAGSGIAATTTAYDDGERVVSETGARAAASGGPTTTTTQYDTAGRPYRVTTPRGNNTAPASGNWVDDGVTQTVFDALDRPYKQTEYAVDGSGALDASKTRTTVTCYDLAGDLRQVTSPRGSATVTACPSLSLPAAYVYTPSATHTTKLEYDEAHRQIKTIQPNSKFTRTTYDLNGQVVSRHDENNTRTDAVYDKTGRLVKTIEPYSATKDIVSVLEYDPLDRVTKEVSPRGYDTAGGSPPFASYSTEYAYDALNRKVRTTLPSGAPSSLSYQATVLADKPIGYWRLGNASNPQVDLGSAPSHNINFSGTTTTAGQPGALAADGDTALTFNVAQPGGKITTTDFDVGAPSIEFWMKDSSGAGTVEFLVGRWYSGWKVTLESGGRIKYSEQSDSSGNGLHTQTPSGTDYRDGNWHHVAAVHDTRVGKQRIYIDGALVAEGNPVGIYYGAAQDYAFGGAVGAQPFSGMLDEVAYYNRDLTAGEIKRHYVIGKQLHGQNAAQSTYTHTLYDANGRVTAQTLPTTATTIGAVPATDKSAVTYWDTDQVRSSTDPAGQPVYYDYTAEGWQAMRVPEATGQPGVLDWSRVMYWTYLPDGLLTGLADIGGVRSTYTYDADGAQTQALQALGLSGGSGTLAIDTTLDSLGQISKVRQPDPTTANRWLAALYSYDLNGNLDTFTDNRQEDATGTQTAPGRVSAFTFDANDRPITVTDDYATPATSTDDEKVEYTYTDDQMLATRTLSKNTAGWVAENKLTATYSLNRLVKTLTNADGTNATVEQHTISHLTAAGVYLNGNKISDDYLLKGPQSGVPCWSTTCTASWAYDARDRLVHENTGTGQTGTSSSVNLQTLDTIGNVTFDTQTSQTRTYSGQRLVDNGSNKLIYDAFGNVDCLTPSAYAGATCPTSGSNLIKDYLYDFKSRLVGTRDYNAGTLQKSTDITIDPLDRPIRQVDTPVGSTATTTTMVYQGATDRLSKEILTGGTSSTRSYWYGGHDDRLTLTDTTAGRLGYLYDPHGSVSLLINQTNVVKRSYGYTGYGGSISSISQSAGGFTDPNKYRYTARRWDTATGTYDIGLRRYNPDLNRWLQQDLYYDALDNLDLTADPLNANRYLFTGANPVNYVDLDGHRVIEGESAGIPACLISAIYCGDGPVEPTNDLDYALGAVAGGAVVARMLPKVLSRTAKALCSVLCKEPVKSVARTEPRTLFEKLALDEAKGGAGRRIMQGRINDRRYPEDVWAKMQHRRVAYRGQAVVIHYWKNLQTGATKGFKFK